MDLDAHEQDSEIVIILYNNINCLMNCGGIRNGYCIKIQSEL